MQLHLKQLLALQMMGVELGLSFAPRDHFSCAFAVDDLRAFRGEGRGLITYAIDVIALHNDERIRDDVGGAWIDECPVDERDLPVGSRME